MLDNSETLISRFHCYECGLTLEDFLGNIPTECPQCGNLLREKRSNIIPCDREKALCLICSRKFGYIPTMPRVCPTCNNDPSNGWEDPMPPNKIFQLVDELAEKNINYGIDPVLGFPGAKPLPLAVEIYQQLVKEHPNNIGIHTNREPGQSETGFTGTQEMERQVIAMLASLMEGRPETIDGYITSGGTEANITACWMGRNISKSGKTAIITSFLSHYSIAKAADLLNIEDLHFVGTDPSGHVLIEKLEQVSQKLITSGITKLIVIANGGTTMLGSVDDVPMISQMIDRLKSTNPQVHFHLHVDAAFGGLIIPFLDHLPKIGFSNPNVSSIGIDMHKMGLTPYGSGIIMAKKGYFARIHTHAPYVPGDDHTLIGSRSGAMAGACLAALKFMGKSGYRETALNLYEKTNIARKKLEKAGFTVINNDINIIPIIGPNPGSRFIVHSFDRFPVDLSSPDKSPSVNLWNIVVMHYFVPEIIDELLGSKK